MPVEYLLQKNLESQVATQEVGVLGAVQMLLPGLEHLPRGSGSGRVAVGKSSQPGFPGLLQVVLWP